MKCKYSYYTFILISNNYTKRQWILKLFWTAVARHKRVNRGQSKYVRYSENNKRTLRVRAKDKRSLRSFSIIKTRSSFPGHSCHTYIFMKNITLYCAIVDEAYSRVYRMFECKAESVRLRDGECLTNETQQAFKWKKFEWYMRIFSCDLISAIPWNMG